MREARCRVLLLLLNDLFTAAFVLAGCLWIYHLMGAYYTLEECVGLWPLVPVMLLCNAAIRLYHGNPFYPGAALGPVEELRRVFLSVSLSYLLLFGYLALTRQVELYSRVALVASWGLTFLLLPLTRWWCRSLMKRWGVGQIPVLIAGAGLGGQLMVQRIARDKFFGVRAVGFVDDHPDKQGTEVGGVPVLGKLADGVRIGRERQVSYVICCVPFHIMESLLKQYSEYFLHVLLVPSNEVFSIAWSYPVNLDGCSALEIRNQLLMALPRVCKWLAEVVIAVLAIVMAFPLLLVIGLGIKLTSRGPMLYRANRLGVGGKPIRVLKFRTMYADADQRLEQLLAEDPELEREWREKFKLVNDPRITPLGRFLRKTSLDELPQFWNVLTGEMAVIGPRPIVADEVKYYGDKYELLKRVKPGITGLWQVSGRSEVDYPNRVALDMNYIMNWSIWMDYFIFLKTIKEVLFCRGAY